MATPVHVEQSRAVPFPVAHTFEVTAQSPLPELFSRRYAVLPPIKEVRDQTGGPWATQLGQSRTIRLADGGSMREELTVLDAPRRFGYELTRITGAMKPLVERVEGEWRFDEVGTGTRVTWAWTLHPTSGRTAPVVRLIGRFWLGYARQALEELEKVLVRG